MAEASYLTVKELVRLVGVSERTIRADIRSGRLTVQRAANGRIQVPRGGLSLYARTPVAGQETMSPRAYAAMRRVSLRTVRRAIAAEKIPVVHFSRRRIGIVISLREQTMRAAMDAMGSFSIAPLLTVRQVSAALKETPSAIYHLIDQGAIDAVKINGTIRIPASELQSLKRLRSEPAK